jgi:hypothetical protein
MNAIRNERTRSEDAPRLGPAAGEADRLTQWMVAQLVHARLRPHPSPRMIALLLKSQTPRAGLQVRA